MQFKFKTKHNKKKRKSFLDEEEVVGIVRGSNLMPRYFKLLGFCAISLKITSNENTPGYNCLIFQYKTNLIIKAQSQGDEIIIIGEELVKVFKIVMCSIPFLDLLT